MPEKLSYCGRDIDEMSREELIEAIRTLYEMYETQSKSYREMNRTWHAIARASRR